MDIVDIAAKPRLLIVDDSRIVRTALIRRIAGMFDFREALDGEQAWETILIDPSIRVVITDLTMPRLDGYGLLNRIRTSKISRIRNLPVVMVSGSDEPEQERERARAYGATDLITKGIDTAQLLSRLDVLSRLVNTQQGHELGIDMLLRRDMIDNNVVVTSADSLLEQAEHLRQAAYNHRKRFILLNLGVGLKYAGLDGHPAIPPAFVMQAVGSLLQRTVRQVDRVARTGDGEFTLITTANLHVDSARHFAQRMCDVINRANLFQDERISFVSSCGLVVCSPNTIEARSLAELRSVAQSRASLGLMHSVSGVVGKEEEIELKADNVEQPPTLPTHDAKENDSPPDLGLLLQLAKEGKHEQAIEHIRKFSSELQPLIDLLQQQGRA